jgi:hypothetical protein
VWRIDLQLQKIEWAISNILGGGVGMKKKGRSPVTWKTAFVAASLLLLFSPPKAP